KIETSVPLIVGRIAKEDARGGTRGKFVRDNEARKGDVIVNGCGRKNVKKMASHVKCLNPESGRKSRMKEERPNDVIYGTDHARFVLTCEDTRIGIEYH
ncbi:hypothetical protein Tco_1035538, partial [Tanacetum coccineum]